MWRLYLLCCLVFIIVTPVSSNGTIEYLLNATLATWKVAFTREIKTDVWHSTKIVLGELSQLLQERLQQQKFLLESTRRRLTIIEEENALLKQRLQSLDKTPGNSENSKGGFNGNGIMGVHASGSSGFVAYGEHKTGDVTIVDVNTGSRWMLASERGILGMVYHPVIKTIYTINMYISGTIRAINIYTKTSQVVAKCGACFGLGLDAKVNHIYLLRRSKMNEIGLHRVYLNPKKVEKMALTKYPSRKNPRSLTVDDVSQRIYIMVGSIGEIHAFDYKGKKVDKIVLEQEEVDKSSTFSMTLDKVNRVLYFTVDDELYRKDLNSDEAPEYVDVLGGRSYGLTYVNNNRLIMTGVDHRRIDSWTQEGGIETLVDLGERKNTGSKYICVLS